MKYINTIIIFLIAGQMSSGCAHDMTASLSNENRQVRFAERVVMIELVRSLSATAKRSPVESHETGAIELAIGLLGINPSHIPSSTLVNLLGLQLDGAGSEELNCQILIRGAQIVPYLNTLDANNVSEHCRTNFASVRKRELADISDVKVDDVCRDPRPIQHLRDELLTAVEAKTECPF